MGNTLSKFGSHKRTVPKLDPKEDLGVLVVSMTVKLWKITLTLEERLKVFLSGSDARPANKYKYDLNLLFVLQTISLKTV